MDVLRSYSNRPDLLNDLERTARNLRQCLDGPAETSISVRSARTPAAVWHVSDRLTEADIAAVITRYHEGATGKQLAAEFGIGLTNVKRLLREHKARRKDRHT